MPLLHFCSFILHQEKGKVNEKNAEKEYTKQFDYDIIQNNVSFRTRRPGDYITIHPDGRTQKLKSFFINEKIPQEEREHILVVAEGSHILWIVGYRKNCVYEVNEETKNILEIKIILILLVMNLKLGQQQNGQLLQKEI